MAEALRKDIYYKGETGGYQTTDQAYQAAQAGRTMSGQYKSSITYRAANDNADAANDNDVASRVVTKSAAAPAATNDNQIARQTVSRRSRPRASARGLATTLKNPKAGVKGALKVAKQGKAVGTFWSIIAWGTPVYVFQFVCALFLILALGLGGKISSFLEDAGWVGNILSNIAGAIFDGLSGLLESLGLGSLPDPTETIPAMLGIFMLLPFILGLGTLIAMSVQYVVTLHNPFTGRRASLKMTAFILALIGYFLPILNLFPWALAWALIVLRYPN